jgi:hypothetical protein
VLYATQNLITKTADLDALKDCKAIEVSLSKVFEVCVSVSVSHSGVSGVSGVEVSVVSSVSTCYRPLSLHTHAHTHKHTCVCVCVCTHTHTHTHTH